MSIKRIEELIDFNKKSNPYGLILDYGYKMSNNLDKKISYISGDLIQSKLKKTVIEHNDFYDFMVIVRHTTMVARKEYGRT